jgi:hypothetical protein
VTEHVVEPLRTELFVGPEVIPLLGLLEAGTQCLDCLDERSE